MVILQRPVRNNGGNRVKVWLGPHLHLHPHASHFRRAFPGRASSWWAQGGKIDLSGLQSCSATKCSRHVKQVQDNRDSLATCRKLWDPVRAGGQDGTHLRFSYPTLTSEDIKRTCNCFTKRRTVRAWRRLPKAGARAGKLALSVCSTPLCPRKISLASRSVW
jgi:hypothetical protein